MLEHTILYVAYQINPPRRSGQEMFFSDHMISRQQKNIQEFLAQKSNAKLVKTFIESSDIQRSKSNWHQLKEAIDYCLEHHAHLIIGEIRNLTHNDTFTEQILRLINPDNAPNLNGFEPQIYCCDQPFIGRDNFHAIVEHARKQKEFHGQLIKQGLSRSTAKSGNPHALEVITKVNKPKVDNAILFALMLQPIISDYMRKGYSQRRMVQALNDEGFTAPEGGPWVLSQLQKVLERIKINEAALTLEKQFLEYRNRNKASSEIAEQLNKLGVPSPKGERWEEDIVDNVSERIKQLHDIIRFNEFVIELMPILEKYHIDEFTEEVLANELKTAGITLPSHISLVNEAT